jgi:hypothetical protein
MVRESAYIRFNKGVLMTAKPTKTRSQKVADDVQALLRARNPLIWVVTREEARVERHLIEAAAGAAYTPRTWDVAQGVCAVGGARQSIGGEDLGETLKAIGSRAAATASSPERGVWILRDAPAWLDGLPGAQPCRMLRNLARALPASPRDRAQAIVILTPSGKVPAELAGHTTVIEWPLPDRAEIAGILDATLAALPEDIRDGAAPNGARDAAIDAAVGLSGDEAQACYAKSLVQSRRIDPAIVAAEKKRVVSRDGLLEWYDPIEGGIDAIGGLEPLKGWLAQRKLAYSPEARAYGLPAPKGMLLVGPPGTGKSLTAKAVPTAWQCPLIRVDLGALKSKFVGESESNLRKAFGTIAAIGRCCVWFDEVEKALQGATSGSADGGVSTDALGAILTWMQERQGEAFVIATANDATALPPELLRKGRFDEIFFIDLPNLGERADVLRAALRSNKRDKVAIDHAKVAAVTDGWTGSEIAAIVPDSLFAAFADGAREITTDDLLTAAKSVVPLSKTAAEKITRLREWAAGRTRPANTPYVADAKTASVELDI